VPTASRSRTVSASVQDLWELITDPHHLPRWWPRVERVEDVHDGAFTEVMRTRKGKVVRADFSLLDADEHTRTLRWEQRLAGTPFEQVLRSSLTEVRLAPAAAGEGRAAASLAGGSGADAQGATEVTIELRQELTRWQSHALVTGLAPRLGSYMVRRAALSTIEQALEGLQRISG
jgi:uncharacterized protein YndB with AHSA1/START domain